MEGGYKLRVAIVDYSLGNLFSVQQACHKVGLEAFITAEKRDILTADAVILPGVGAFGDAMDCLRQRDLVRPLQDIAQSGKFLIGICLGQQLLMTESFEFGRHRGLNIIEGPVVRFENPMGPSGPLKVPQVGWNRIYRPDYLKQHLAGDCWHHSPLENLRDGEYMYFVHSYYAQPADPSVVLSVTRYGHIEFCSSLRRGNVMAFQFHPERSGPAGIHIYRNLARLIAGQLQQEASRHAA
ncbi:MAG: imidazole glycerol phosphate synthase subunit HisH [Gemmatales bacterium]|nr:imidazole glycerol phosphate synthase subunit HisH [Gemmatales bacterium]MDW8174102.1 imidazole glycerol phosphate synthase subunit HisH [Gemmatales bacterium]